MAKSKEEIKTDERKVREEFFDHLFAGDEGYVCIATGDANNPRNTFRQSFFRWPTGRLEMLEYVDAAGGANKNVWFGVNLLDKAERKKGNCIPDDLVWADLDTCPPDKVQPTPSIVIESSPGRFQAIWRLEHDVPADEAEELSKRIAYAYVQSGADPSGWDLTQLLRVPGTSNFKYDPAPQVMVRSLVKTRVPHIVFDIIPKVTAKQEEEDPLAEDLPKLDDLPPPDMVCYKYLHSLQATDFGALYTQQPPEEADWSALLWRMVNICFECGMDRNEVFTVASAAKCNKYARDRRSPKYLWHDVLKAERHQKKIFLILGDEEALAMPTITDIDDDGGETFIDRYRQWGEVATDAVPEFHDLCGAIVLSALLAAHIYTETSYTKIVPNLWGLILGESTLTRKTTAMRLAMDLVSAIDDEVIAATDGSAEGLLTTLSARHKRASIFYKDEVSGFFDKMNKQDYLAGMAETLTQLYDVPSFFQRVLRKETITIIEPIFIFFGGGVTDRTYALISEEHITSGFMPRFLVTTGNTDLDRLRRTGPATQDSAKLKLAVHQELASIHNRYTGQVEIVVAGAPISIDRKTEAKLTSVAWERYGEIEYKMLEAANFSSHSPLALPTFERLSRSLLKLAILIGASRREVHAATLTVQIEDVNAAARYVQRWGASAVDLILNAGKGTHQRQLDQVLDAIKMHPGISKSAVMRRFHLTRKDNDAVLGTLEDRGQILIKREGGRGSGARIYPIV